MILNHKEHLHYTEGLKHDIKIESYLYILGYKSPMNLWYGTNICPQIIHWIHKGSHTFYHGLFFQNLKSND